MLRAKRHKGTQAQGTKKVGKQEARKEASKQALSLKAMRKQDALPKRHRGGRCGSAVASVEGRPDGYGNGQSAEADAARHAKQQKRRREKESDGRE